MSVARFLQSAVQRFSEILQLNKAKTSTAHVQYLKDQRKNSFFAFFVSCKISDIDIAQEVVRAREISISKNLLKVHKVILQQKQLVEW